RRRVPDRVRGPADATLALEPPPARTGRRGRGTPGAAGGAGLHPWPLPAAQVPAGGDPAPGAFHHLAARSGRTHRFALLLLEARLRRRGPVAAAAQPDAGRGLELRALRAGTGDARPLPRVPVGLRSR